MAANPFMNFLGNVGQGALNLGARAVGAGLNAGFGALDKGLGNLEQAIRVPPTQQLPQGIQSPIPQSQVVPHPRGPQGSLANSWLGVGLNAAGNAMGNQFAKLSAPIVNPIQQGVQQGMNNMNQWANVFHFGNPSTPPPITHQQVLGAVTQRFSQPQTQPTRLPVRQPTQVQVTPTPTPMPGVSQVQQMPTQIPGITPAVAQNFLSTLQKMLPITRSYGIPDAVAAAQAAQESGYMQKPAGQNNFYGLKAHSYPGFAHFDTPEQGALYYAQTVASKVPNMQGMTPLQVLQALQSGNQHYEGDNPNPMQYVYDVSHNPVWQAFGGGAPYATNPMGWSR